MDRRNFLKAIAVAAVAPVALLKTKELKPPPIQVVEEAPADYSPGYKHGQTIIVGNRIHYAVILDEFAEVDKMREIWTGEFYDNPQQTTTH